MICRFGRMWHRPELSPSISRKQKGKFGVYAFGAASANAAHSDLSEHIEADRHQRRQRAYWARERCDRFRLPRRTGGRNVRWRTVDGAPRLAAGLVIFGILSLLWLFPWSRVVVVEPSSSTRAATNEAPTFREILHQRSLWGVALGCFVATGYYAMLAWLPTYLVKARGLSIGWMTGVASAAYAINAASALAAGWAIDRWVRSGRSLTLAWKIPMSIGYLVLIVCTIGFAVLPINGCVASLSLGMVCGGVTSVGYFAIPQLLAGPSAAARFVGFTNMCGNAAGIVAPALTGMLIDAFGTYWPAFVLIGLVNVLGVIGWVLVLPKIAPICWAIPPQSPPTAIRPPGAL